MHEGTGCCRQKPEGLRLGCTRGEWVHPSDREGLTSRTCGLPQITTPVGTEAKQQQGCQDRWLRDKSPMTDVLLPFLQMSRGTSLGRNPGGGNEQTVLVPVHQATLQRRFCSAMRQDRAYHPQGRDPLTPEGLGMSWYQ